MRAHGWRKEMRAQLPTAEPNRKNGLAIRRREGPHWRSENKCDLHVRTFRSAIAMSALPPKADIRRRNWNVR
jgi:hypothetical protein